MKNGSIVKVIDKVKEKIPTQGPLEYFIHHNTIHHYEHMPFFEAVKKAAIEYSCQAFMPEEYYRNKYKNRVIKRQFLYESMREFLDKNKLSLCPDILYSLLIKYPLLENKFHYQISIDTQNQYVYTREFYHGDLPNSDKNIDLGYYNDELVFQFLQAYFDYGNALWSMPHRDKGMWYCFKLMYLKSSILNRKSKKALSRILKKTEQLKVDELITYILSQSEVDDESKENYLFELIIKYKGWPGFIKSLEEQPEWINVKGIVPDFISFVAIVLVCHYATLMSLAIKRVGEPLSQKLPQHSLNFLDHFFETVARYKDVEDSLMEALPLLTDLNRQQIFHEAYERSFYFYFMSSYSPLNNREKTHQYKYQVVCCIDEREESFRRYIEMDEHCETFGCAGHFGLPILYKGYFDKHYRELCPVNVKGQFKVHEELAQEKSLLTTLIRIIGSMQWFSAVSLKTLFRGYFIVFINFIMTTIPTVLEILDARLTYKAKKTLINYKKRHLTHLKYKLEEGVNQGLSFSKRVEFAKMFLLMNGMTKYISPFVFIFGHGSISLNNPHEAAHDCGACGGGRGAPNARLMADILNDKKVRDELVKSAINIPEKTIFIGAYHNTCSDELEFFDVETLYDDPLFVNVTNTLRNAASLDAKERCRRFNSAKFGADTSYYLEHVYARVLDIRQPRPEYGHATNAVCIVGPRHLTRNLFLDRRAFLVSYNPDVDSDNTVLSTLANTAIPVCAGINLEYYFSYTDNEFYGCGTKLPHNVTSLIGVMNGYMSDLRPGLPWQMVEIHQPVRLLVFIYCSIKSISSLLGEESEFANLVKNGWIKLIIHEVTSDELLLYDNGQFVSYHSEYICPRYILPDNNIMNTKEHVEFGNIVT